MRLAGASSSQPSRRRRFDRLWRRRTSCPNTTCARTSPHAACSSGLVHAETLGLLRGSWRTVSASTVSPLLLRTVMRLVHPHGVHLACRLLSVFHHLLY